MYSICRVACQRANSATSRWKISAVQIAALTALCFTGCIFGTPNDHYRRPDFSDSTLDVAPGDDVLVLNANGKGGRDLYLLRLANRHVTRVAETPEYESCPNFSADGKWLVYAAGIPGDRADHIFVRPVAGGESRQLTSADANDSSPRFSPDGSTIVFDRDKTYCWGGLAANWGGGEVICVVNSDGTNERQITPDGTLAAHPRFTADGKSIVFSMRNGLAQVPADGSAPPVGIPGQMGAVVSPDGGMFAFCEGKYWKDVRLYVSRADGSHQRYLTSAIPGCRCPVFSRDSKRVFFFGGSWPDLPSGSPDYNLWCVSADGNEDPQLVADHWLLEDPMSWTLHAPAEESKKNSGP